MYCMNNIYVRNKILKKNKKKNTISTQFPLAAPILPLIQLPLLCCLQQPHKDLATVPSSLRYSSPSLQAATPFTYSSAVTYRTSVAKPKKKKLKFFPTHTILPLSQPASTPADLLQSSSMPTELHQSASMPAKLIRSVSMPADPLQSVCP